MQIRMLRMLKCNSHGNHKENSFRIYTKKMRKKFKHFTRKKSLKQPGHQKTKKSLLHQHKYVSTHVCPLIDVENYSNNNSH